MPLLFKLYEPHIRHKRVTHLFVKIKPTFVPQQFKMLTIPCPMLDNYENICLKHAISLGTEQLNYVVYRKKAVHKTAIMSIVESCKWVLGFHEWQLYGLIEADYGY